MLHLRPYSHADRAAVYDICVRTADAGGDARGQWSSDDLMPDLFAGPYLHLEPKLATVLDDGGRAVGYVLGTRDTNAFAVALRQRWTPLVAAKYQRPASAAEADLLSVLFGPARRLRPELAPYPAHLHIDLLPAYQRRGWGRVLIERFRAAAGVPVHLGMVTRNTAARAFYDRLGFREILVAGEVTYLGLGPPGSGPRIRGNPAPPAGIAP